jgi:hypothetical protein
MKIKIEGYNFDKRIKEIIEDGWKIEEIKKVQFYQVKLSKNSEDKRVYNSGRPIKKHEFLSVLDRETILEISKCLNVDINFKSTDELLKELEKYKRGVVKVAWDYVIDKRREAKLDTYV